ncbi:FHIPEP family type III secretion protein, partial [Inquilinus sp. CA228]|uniref:FHIPEP family type III secretion protein n=1 Tax=Inquilinus sp. CA228 TaxID=3455609 RepID=UPI003F8D5281
LMILPLPTLLVDVLIACNITFAVLLLMVAVYLRSPLELSVLPPVILTALDTRRFLRQALARNHVEASVLSYAEIASDYTVQPVAVVRLTGRRVRQDAEAGLDRAAAE